MLMDQSSVLSASNSREAGAGVELNSLLSPEFNKNGDEN